VDELCEFSPPLKKDEFFDKMDVDIPYTKNSRKYKMPSTEGSANKAYVLFLCGVEAHCYCNLKLETT